MRVSYVSGTFELYVITYIEKQSRVFFQSRAPIFSAGKLNREKWPGGKYWKFDCWPIFRNTTFIFTHHKSNFFKFLEQNSRPVDSIRKKKSWIFVEKSIWIFVPFWKIRRKLNFRWIENSLNFSHSKILNIRFLANFLKRDIHFHSSKINFFQIFRKGKFQTGF